MRRKTPYFLPPSSKAAPTIRNYTNMSIIYLRCIQLRQPWIPFHAAAPQVRGRAREGANQHLPLGNVAGRNRPARGLAEHAVFGQKRGAGQSPPTGRTDRVKGGQIWRAKSLPQKPGGLRRKVYGDGPLEAGWRLCHRVGSPTTGTIRTALQSCHPEP